MVSRLTGGSLSWWTRPARRAGTCSASQTESLELSASELIGGAEERGDPLELLDREPLGQHRLPVRRHRSPNALGGSVEGIGYLQSHAPAVHRVRHAPRIARALEPVDDSGDGARGKPRLAGQLPRRESAAVFDDVEAPKIGLTDAQPLGGEAVERVVLVAARPEFADELFN